MGSLSLDFFHFFFFSFSFFIFHFSRLVNMQVLVMADFSASETCPPSFRFSRYKLRLVACRYRNCSYLNNIRFRFSLLVFLALSLDVALNKESQSLCLIEIFMLFLRRVNQIIGSRKIDRFFFHFILCSEKLHSYSY